MSEIEVTYDGPYNVVVECTDCGTERGSSVVTGKLRPSRTTYDHCEECGGYRDHEVVREAERGEYDGHLICDDCDQQFTNTMDVDLHDCPANNEESEDDEDESEVACDGGEDTTAHVSDEDIEQAIRLKDDPDHEDALSVAEVRDMLAHIQSDFETFWGEIVEAIQGGHLEVLADDGDVIVIRDDDMAEWTEWLNAAGIDDEIARSVVQLSHNAAGSRIADFQAAASDLLVVRKPRSFDGGRDYVEAVVNGLQKRGLSPGQAWAYYGVEIRGESRNAWGRRKGDHDHKNVSDALENAKSKLP